MHFDDVREPLGCEYVVQLCLGAQGPYIAAGNKMYVYTYLAEGKFFCSSRNTNPFPFLGICSDKRLDLIPLVSTPTWRFDLDNLWRLPGAHGDEVVRSVYLDEQVCLRLKFGAWRRVFTWVTNARCITESNRLYLW